MKITHNCMKFITMMSVIFHENKDTQTNRFPQQTLHCCQKIGPDPPSKISKEINHFLTQGFNCNLHKECFQLWVLFGKNVA